HEKQAPASAASQPPQARGGTTQAKGALETLEQEVRLARDALAQLPHVRHETVDTLRGEVRRGTYGIDARDLAQDIIRGNGSHP
ncbi:MAG: flagellar biosynthesis anti-sigma factor FlgM, partial [Armatimonadota bacterium]